jgi:hypothetical protein
VQQGALVQPGQARPATKPENRAQNTPAKAQ